MAELSIAQERHRVPSRPSPFNGRTLSGLVVLMTIVWSLAQTGLFKRDLINEGGWTIALRFVQAAVRPELAPDFLVLTADAALVTLAYAVCGTVVSLLFGSIGGLLSSEVWWQSILPDESKRLLGLSGYRIPWFAIRGLLAIPRAIHELIWGLFFINIIGLNPLTAVLAIGIPFGAITAKVFSELLDETPRQPLMALQHSGVTPLKAFFYTLFPQAFPNLLSYAFYRFECSIRAAAVLGIIGAGGLGYQILLSLQSLRYEQMWTLILVLCLLSSLSDSWSSLLRRRLHLTSRLTLNARDLSGSDRWSYQSDPVIRFSLLAAVFLVPFSFWYIDANFSRVFSAKTTQLLIDVIHDSYPPNFESHLTTELFRLSLQTLAMSILAITGAGLAGILFSFPAANNFLLPGGILNTGGSHRRSLWLGATVLLLTRGILLLSRAVPAPVWAMVALFVFFPGILPGAIGLGIYNFGILGRLMAEVTENLDTRPLRALKAQGASGAQVFLYGVLPRTLPSFVTYILYRWEVCLRETVIVGLVGAGGLGRLLTEQLSSFDYRSVITTLIFFIALTFIVDLISTSLQRMIRQ